MKIITFIFCFVSIICYGQTKPRVFSELMVSEKVYLTTDKDIYSFGDSVKVKGFVFDTFEGKSENVSRFIYVELVNHSDDVLFRHKLRRDSLGFSTIFVVDSTFKMTNYFLRGYTHSMKYAKPEYIYTRQIIVDSNKREEQSVRSNLEILSDNSDYNVSFFAEGGCRVDNTPQRVAFKATDKYGIPVNTDGYVISEKNDTVTYIKSMYNGFGEFLMCARANENYFFKSSDGKRLPINIPKGASLKVVRDGNEIRYKVDGVDNRYVLLVHTSGALLYKKEIDNKNDFGAINVKNLKEGILCFTLLSGNNIVSERLYYVDSKEKEKLFTTSLEDDNIVIKPTVNLNGDFAITLLKTDKINNPTFRSGITSNILIQSDLKEVVVNLDNLILDTSRFSKYMLDVILLTHTNDKYITDISEIDKSFGAEKTESIMGSVVNPRVKSVLVYSKTIDEIYAVDVDENKGFYAELPDFIGDAEFFLQPILGSKKIAISEVQIMEKAFPEVKNIHKKFASPYINLATRIVDSRDKANEYVLTPVNRRYNPNDGSMVLAGEEVTVSGRRRDTTKVNTEKFYKINSLEEEDIYKYSNFNIASAVDRLINVTVTLNPTTSEGFPKYKINSGRGPSFSNSDKIEKDGLCPMGVLVDGMLIDPDIALRMAPEQVSSIKKLSIAESSVIVGSRGGICGVISITTKASMSQTDKSESLRQGTLIDKLGYTPQSNNMYNKYFSVKTVIDKPIVIEKPKSKGVYMFKIEGIASDGNIIEYIEEIKL